jgi:peptidoglycan/LPS O-acetylase OafA/YrhL
MPAAPSNVHEPALAELNQVRRIFELDALRALAALNLMLFHFTWVYSEKYGFATDLEFKYAYGKYGTQLFFMLSGLVNAMTLLRKNSASYYIQSRAIRILPPFLLVLGLNLWLVQLPPLRDHMILTWDTVLANATLVPNLLGYACVEPVIWTLQVELQFYAILLVLFLSGGLQRPFRSILGCIFFCLLFEGAIQQLPATVVGETGRAVLEWLKAALMIEYFPLFAMGMLVHQGFLERTQWIKYGGGILVAMAAYHVIQQRHSSPAVTLLLIGLLVASQYGKLPLLRSQPLLFISGISYSLYLLHNNLGSVIIYQLDQWGLPPLWCVGVAMILVVALSAWAAYWIERPIGAGIRSLLKWRQLRSGTAAENPMAIVPNQPAT